eukprot:Seg3162.2 transcript_id=Seg3162.2/GoldUCD/mRNA.D3Y31 product="Methylthioribulose-1-phosphate dehydratase" protein_id=Seg3162.2/GoldUCD/D3Y31
MLEKRNRLSGVGIPDDFKHPMIVSGGNSCTSGTTSRKLQDIMWQTNMLVFVNEARNSVTFSETLLQAHDGFMQGSSQSGLRASQAKVLITSNAEAATRTKASKRQIFMSYELLKFKFVQKLKKHFYKLTSSDVEPKLDVHTTNIHNFKIKGEKTDGKIYVTPSGVQKERVKPEDLFVCDEQGNVTESPDKSGMKMSSCATFFLRAYKHRGAQAVMHTHSKAAFMASVVFPGDEIKLTHMQMIRGIKNDKTKKNFGFNEELVIPVIENRLAEIDLVDPLEEAMLAYPETPCVLVRRHGIYVWGESWEKTKIMCECYDYLFEMAVQMKLHGVDPSLKPV